MTIPFPWSTALLRMDVFPTGFAPSLESPLKMFRMCLPLVTIVGLGVVVWWRGRRDGGEMRRCVEVAVEMVRCRCVRWCWCWDLLNDATTQPTPHTLLCVFGYSTTALLVLDVRILMLLVPLALLGTCNLRLSTQRPTDVGGELMVPETPVRATSGKLSSIPNAPATVSHPPDQSRSRT